MPPAVAVVAAASSMPARSVLVFISFKQFLKKSDAKVSR
jgi:hypothetical protein